MNDSTGLVLHAATQSDMPLLANLLEFYMHDLSEIFSIEVDQTGRFGYPKLPLYWAESERRFPFIIRIAGRLGGFALITRGSPMSDDPDVFDVAEFFVLRRYRRSGLGRQAAIQLWDRFAGGWIVRVSEGNRVGVPFWRSIISDYSGGAASESTKPGTSYPWRVFAFTSGART